MPASYTCTHSCSDVATNISTRSVRCKVQASVGTTRACLPIIEGGESCWPLSSPPRRVALCSRFAAPRAPPCFCKTCAMPEAADTDLRKMLGLLRVLRGRGEAYCTVGFGALNSELCTADTDLFRSRVGEPPG